MSSISDKGDLPASVDIFTNCAVEDLREGDDREGVTLLPTPCSEFIEAFLKRVGVEARASTLMEEELRRRGLREGALAVGDETAGDRCPSRDGELTCGEEGREDERTPGEFVVIESRCRDGGKLLLLLLLLLPEGAPD